MQADRTRTNSWRPSRPSATPHTFSTLRIEWNIHCGDGIRWPTREYVHYTYVCMRYMLWFWAHNIEHLCTAERAHAQLFIQKIPVWCSAHWDTHTHTDVRIFRPARQHSDQRSANERRVILATHIAHRTHTHTSTFHSSYCHMYHSRYASHVVWKSTWLWNI